jgi:putative tricarboxylic transport membrane protein
VLFMATARAFGSRRWLVDGALGLTIAVLSFVVFNHGLDLNLPAGILADLIEQAP